MPGGLENGGPPGPRVGFSPWNAHSVASLGVCPRDGTLHIAWDSHGGSLRYLRSIEGLLGSQSSRWGATSFAPERNWLVSADQPVKSITYPQFITTPSGDLQLIYRRGRSGWGDVMLASYWAEGWTAPRLVIAKEGDYEDVVGKSSQRNAYINGAHYGPDGRLHLSWCWREQPGAKGNHSIAYAYSADEGATWRNGADQVLAASPGEAITIASPGIDVASYDRTWSLHNQQAQTVDGQGRVHILMWHRRPEIPNAENIAGWRPEVSGHFHYVRDPASGAWSRHVLPGGVFGKGSVAPRPKIAHDARGVLYALFAAPADLVPGVKAGVLAVARATPEAGYNDWRVIYIGERVFDGEPLFDSMRMARAGVLSVLWQEAAPVGDKPAGARLHVLDLTIPGK